MADADMEDYGFEYSDEEPEEQDVDIENQYYNTKGTCLDIIHLKSFIEAQLALSGFWTDLSVMDGECSDR